MEAVEIPFSAAREFPRVDLSPVPMFRPRNQLTKEQLTDPDYAMKQLIEMNEKMGTSKLNITCSKCHHCR